MTESQFPQCRVIPFRMLFPETVENYLNTIVKINGIRRMMVKGPSIPATVPYGPARGIANTNSNRRTIKVGDTDMDLRVQVGMIDFEVESQSVVDEIRRVSQEFFTKFPCQVKEGRFIKTEASLTDYCKYGPDADPMKIGLVDPKRKETPVILQGIR